METLHFTEPELEVKLAKAYKPANKNNAPTSTYTTGTLHIAVEPSNQSMTIDPSPAQHKYQK